MTKKQPPKARSETKPAGPQAPGGPEKPRPLEIVHAISGIGREQWDMCANPADLGPAAETNLSTTASPPEPDSICEQQDTLESLSQDVESLSQVESYNPLISYDFLSSLEDSQCVDN